MTTARTPLRRAMRELWARRWHPAVVAFVIVSAGCVGARSTGVPGYPAGGAPPARTIVLTPGGALTIPAGYRAYMSRAWDDVSEGCFVPNDDRPVIYYKAGTVGWSSDELGTVWRRSEPGVEVWLVRGAHGDVLHVGMAMAILTAVVRSDRHVDTILEIARSYRLRFLSDPPCRQCEDPESVNPSPGRLPGEIVYTGCPPREPE
jgi:hypothetical protein